MLKQIEVSDIPGKSTMKLCKVQQEVMGFWESGWPAAEVTIEGYKNEKSACAAYRAAIKTCKVGVTAMTRDGRLFLIRDRVD